MYPEKMHRTTSLIIAHNNNAALLYHHTNIVALGLQPKPTQKASKVAF